MPTESPAVTSYNDGGPVFPDEIGDGRSLRAYIATHALAAVILSAPDRFQTENAAAWAVAFADALLERLRA